jgi:RNA polymerase sigma-32 factor
MQGATFISEAPRYIKEIRRAPMLEAQEEYLLAKSWREHRDREAPHKLVTSHLRLVVKIATSYRGYGLPIPDLISEGSIGLMRAVDRFEPDEGFRFATYAVWWIRAEIQNYVLRSRSLVKMGTIANQRRLFFNLWKIKGRMSVLDDGDMLPDQVQRRQAPGSGPGGRHRYEPPARLRLLSQCTHP